MQFLFLPATTQYKTTRSIFSLSSNHIQQQQPVHLLLIQHRYINKNKNKSWNRHTLLSHNCYHKKPTVPLLPLATRRRQQQQQQQRTVQLLPPCLKVSHAAGTCNKRRGINHRQQTSPEPASHLDAGQGDKRGIMRFTFYSASDKGLLSPPATTAKFSL